MSCSSFEVSLSRVLAHEGGYTNHSSDPGGPTNFGITIADYRKYVKPNAGAADVRAMTVEEAKAIYRARYWDALRCDELPAGVDYAVFDYGVNSGIGRSGKVLRRALKLPDNTSAVTDAVIGAACAADAKTLIAAISDERLRFLQSLKTWDVFGKGWGRRVAEVRKAALAMAAAPGKARHVREERSPGSLTKAGSAAAAAGGAVLAAHQAGVPAWPIIGLALAAAVVAALVILFIASRKGSPMSEKIKAWFKHSVTILWARAVACIGLLLAGAQSLLSDAGVNNAVQSLLEPRYVPYYVIVIGIVTEIARRRTAGKDA